MNVRQALSSDKRFLSPRRGSNLQPSDNRWDAPTIELPRRRWWAMVQVRHICDLSGSHYMLVMIWWLPLRSHICRTYTLADHLSLGSSMVRASHRSLEGCGFVPHWGSEIVLLRIGLDERSSIILRYVQAPTLLKYISYYCLVLCLFYKRNGNCFVVFIWPDENTRGGWENSQAAV